MILQSCHFHIFLISISLFFIYPFSFQSNHNLQTYNNFDQPRFILRPRPLVPPQEASFATSSNPFLLIQQFGRHRFETRNNTVDWMATTRKSSLVACLLFFIREHGLVTGEWTWLLVHPFEKILPAEVMRPGGGGDKRKWREKACVCALRSRRQANTSWKRVGIGGKEVVVDERRYLVPGNRAIRGGGRRRKNGMDEKKEKAVDEGPQIIT